MNCYHVTLPCTNSQRDAACVAGRYITVEDGGVYVLAEDAGVVGRSFPAALSIKRVGMGMMSPLDGVANGK